MTNRHSDKYVYFLRSYVPRVFGVAVFLVTKVVFNTKTQVPSSENSLLLGKDY